MQRNSQPTQNELNGISAHFFFCLVLLGLGICGFFVLLVSLKFILISLSVVLCVYVGGWLFLFAFLRIKRGSIKLGG